MHNTVQSTKNKQTHTHKAWSTLVTVLSEQSASQCMT